MSDAWCAQLDGLMTRAGFAPGQIGVNVDEVSVVYCAQFHEFRDRFPLVAPEIDYSGGEGACTDLNIYVELGEVPRLTEAASTAHQSATSFEGSAVMILLRKPLPSTACRCPAHSRSWQGS